MTTSLSKLFVGGLSWGTIDSVLFEEFAKYGPLDEAIVVRDKVTGRSRGFGFVRFQDPEDAQRAKEATDGNPIDGRVVRVDFASEKRRPPMSMNPYDNPYGASPIQANFMGGYPNQASYMPPQNPMYGYSPYSQPMMGGMGPANGMMGMYQPQSPMHPMQQYQQQMPRNNGYSPQAMIPPHPQHYQAHQQPSPPAGFAQTAAQFGEEGSS